MYRCNGLVRGAGGLAIALLAFASQAEPQWQANRLPDGLAGVPLDQRVDYLHKHLINPANASAQSQLARAEHALPTSAQLGAIERKSVPSISPNSLVIETFITPAMTDEVVAALCALKGIDDRVEVNVEHRNYVVLEPETVTPSVTASTQCLDRWRAKTDYGGRITQARGVPELPYFAAHYGGTTVQGDLADYRHKIEQLAMQYGL